MRLGQHDPQAVRATHALSQDLPGDGDQFAAMSALKRARLHTDSGRSVIPLTVTRRRAIKARFWQLFQQRWHDGTQLRSVRRRVDRCLAQERLQQAGKGRS
jgi:hypothetical protein